MRDNHAILLIDLQVDFLESDGRLPISQAQVPTLLDACHSACQQASEMNWPVVAIGNKLSHWDPLNLARRFASLKGSAGSQWDPRAPPATGRLLFKTFPSAFSNLQLDSWMRERHISNLHVAGLQAKACVKATAKAALSKGYRVYLIESAIGDTSEAARASAPASLRDSGCAASWLADPAPSTAKAGR